MTEAVDEARERWTVLCYACDAQGPHGATPNEAQGRWDERSRQASVKGRV
jgi:hypothetical protein